MMLTVLTQNPANGVSLTWDAPWMRVNVASSRATCRHDIICGGYHSIF
jgi:hypothetical protein